MPKSKLTVTISRNDYERIEEEKRKKGVSRSALVESMIKFFFVKEDEQFKIKKYIDGYKKIPEKINDIVQLEQVQCEILDKDF
ncbi:MAG: ribbon-helix-helix protein, CopG family [Candidatus Atribacteria bacterium]|nr:ribbon-helix-helix protein, CopG family [Candidatus Atribacteria bacterium]